MYPVSADFHNLSIADAPTSRVRIYFIEANVDCTDDNDVQSNGTLLCMPGETDSNGRIEKGGVTINEFFNSDANVQIGATVSSQIGMTLINRDGALDGFNYGRCKVYIDVYDDTNSTWLTCPMGVYNIAIPKRRKVQLVSATGYDQMQQLDEIADSWWNGLDWSNGITLLQIIQSMAATLGIHLSANTSANIVNSGLSYTEIPFTAIEMTYRDILSYIAETTGTIARFDRNGALDLRWFSDAVLSTDTQTYAGGLVTFTATDRARISSLSVPFSPIQDLHGYDHPWPGGGGKNLAELTNPELTTNTSQKVATLNKTGTFNIVLSFDLTNADCVTASSALFDLVANGSNNYVLPTSLRRVSDGTYWGNITKPVTGRFYYLFESKTDPTGLYVYFESASYGKWSGSMSNVQLEIGTSPTTFAPYSNICPISGRTGVDVWDDPKYGGNVYWNQHLQYSNAVATYSKFDLSITRITDTFGFHITGTSNYSSGDRNCYIYTPSPAIPIQSGHVYIATNTSEYLCVYLYGASFTGNKVNADPRGGVIVKATSSANLNLSLHHGSNIANGTVFDEDVYINLVDLTEAFGATKAEELYQMEQTERGSGVAWFTNLFPKPYYAYNAGEETCVSAVNGGTYTKVSVDWASQAGTVYGGTVDVVTGVLTVTMASVDLGTLTWRKGTEHKFYTTTDVVVYKPYTPQMLCDTYKFAGVRSASPWYGDENELTCYYVGTSIIRELYINDPAYTDLTEFQTAMSGVQLVYELATPITYQLTPTQVAVLAGTNNVWSTGDSVSVTVAEPNLVEIQTDTVGNQCLSIDVGEYQVSQIDSLSVKASQADVGVTIGSGGNAYTILDNPMLFGDEAAITTKATPIYNRLSAFRLFTPISMRCIMDWSIEAGDIITVTNESVTYDLPIFQQRLRWRGGYVVSDLFSNGEQERPTQSKEIRSSFRSNTQMHEFEVTLEQLRSYIQSVDGNYTLIQQTVDAITQTVANQNVTIQNILDPTGEIWTAITKNTSNLSSIEDSLNNEITERRSYIRFIPSEPAIVMGVDEDNEIKLKLVNNIIYFFNGADDSTDLSLAYAYFNSQEAFADRFVAGESVQIGTSDNAAHWLWKKLNNGDLVLELVG